jgi:hypothetical protein
MPCEKVELHRENVDINPEYIDSLDSQFFKVNLMFEKSCSIDRLPENKVAGRMAFEEGLNEVRSHFNRYSYETLLTDIFKCDYSYRKIIRSNPCPIYVRY